ncbi:SDR family NAD(P)-dependent oxidoreductase [Aquiluna sp. KACHI24]|uniref:SDR family NAD(P)-dependent oxidoreductase n=1 Tax=Aquiluna sp. KACHI24 TaxID=2968831 RepID=UPI0021FA5926|nr:SDR family NAD(P)-dependent oxidoreductase [Aquiluna sp. KACHI24]BDP99763.1 short-chain dehydrogenase [Aquiluna sp. KACHI24]
MKHALITGASSGLGFESAKALAELGYQVTMVARREERLTKAADRIRALNPDSKISEVVLDISNLDSVREFAKSVDSVDLLMNNAGLMGPDFKLSIEGIESQMATNHIGHFLLTALLWQKLDAVNGRVISLSSVVHRRGKLKSADVDELRGAEESSYDRWQRYADTKLACLLFARELDVRARLSGSKVQSIAAHPGWAITGLQENFPHQFDRFAQTAKAGARSQLRAATDASLKGGEFVGPKWELWGEPKLLRGSTRSRNLELASKLWASSEELTGVKFLA